MAGVFSFPHPVDEVSARLVAGGVVLLSAGYVATGWAPLLVLLTYGFVARTLSGPTLSPWGRVVTRVVRPRLDVAAQPTAGPPKRFAQGIGASLTLAAVVVLLLTGSDVGPRVLVGAVTVAATLESVLGFCLGCRIFAVLMRLGVIPESVCEDCADISRRLAARA
ncbi:MAG TPA: DUF4395 domain-containing protein [Iamia sp.]|nr:DUF4395 domain-containing protein [Iamia sp.]